MSDGTAASISRAQRRTQVLAVILQLSLTVVGCGFRPLHSQLAAHPRLYVSRVVSEVPGPALVALADEVATSTRTELAKFYALSSKGDGDHLEIHIVRWEETSEAAHVIAVPTTNTSASEEPVARGIRLRLTVRGEVFHEGSVWETDDIEVDDVVSSQTGSDRAEVTWTAVRQAGARDLARRAGARLARELLGLP